MQHTFNFILDKSHGHYYVLQSSLTVHLLISVADTLCDILLIVFGDNSLYQYISHSVAYQYKHGRFD